MRVISRIDAGLAPPRKLIPAAPRQRSRLFLHHSVTATTADPLSDWRHVQAAGFGRGFADISYTWGVHATGTALEGRNPGVEGAHTEGFNRTAHAIVLIGNYDVDKPSDLMVAAVRELRAHLVAEGFLTTGHVFSMHRDVKATACPGRHTAARFADFGQPWLAPTPAPFRRTDSTEVDVILDTIEVSVTTTPAGQANAGCGWTRVPFTKTRIKSYLPPGLRPGVDGRFVFADVGFAADDAPNDQGTIVTVGGWAPGETAVVQLEIVN